jgi:hypothetical protein
VVEEHLEHVVALVGGSRDGAEDPDTRVVRVSASRTPRTMVDLPERPSVEVM